MNHNDDAYAAMLLTMALSPNKEEYARPCSVQEFRRIEESARGSRYRSIGGLMNVDISGLMLYLGLSEEEGYRVYTLLHRTVQLSYALEGFLAEGIEVVTLYDEDYPQRIKRRMGASSPPFFYRCGQAELLNGPAIAVVGISGVKTTNEVRDAVDMLVRAAQDKGYTIITGGELGVSRVAESLSSRYGTRQLDVIGGAMREHIHRDEVAQRIASGEGAVLSLEHPDSMFTISHAIARNKVLFSLADAAFVFNTDGRRGETDALHNRYCDWIYAWEGYPGNQSLLARGAMPISSLKGIDFEEMRRHWNSTQTEQISLFDLF